MSENKPDKTPRLKLDIPWQEAAGKLLRTPAKSTPPRATATRKKAATKKPKP